MNKFCKLTDELASYAKPKENAYSLTDGTGLTIKILPNGSKYWRFRFRFDGKEKLLALGVYPSISLSTARDKTRAAKALLTQGIDPTTERKASKLAKQTANCNTAGKIQMEESEDLAEFFEFYEFYKEYKNKIQEKIQEKNSRVITKNSEDMF